MKSQLVKLSDVCRIESGGTPDSSKAEFWNGNINWATLVDVKNKYVGSTKRKITPEGLKNSSAKLLPIGTVLFSSRATIGEVSIAKSEIATNQGFKNFICDPNKIIPEYLYYVLKHEAKKISDSVSSTTFKEISKTKIADYKIPLVSIQDQKGIVKAIDEAASLNEKRKQSINLLDDYLDSTFMNMFGDPETNSKKFEIKTIKDIATKVTDGEHITPIRTTSGIKLLSARNIKNGYLDFNTGVDYIGEEEYQRIRKRCNPEFGDLSLIHI